MLGGPLPTTKVLLDEIDVFLCTIRYFGKLDSVEASLSFNSREELVMHVNSGERERLDVG